ncbi:MAG: Ig-like domain-containing protein [Pantoea vagans]|nr:Ig-like domain-containing protein [Pantoea vagans]
MKIQLIIKDTQGNVIATHALQPGKSLALESMPQAASYEVHSVDGQPPQKIIASKANGQMKFKLVDDVTGEQYDIVLQNVSAEEMPVMTASGSDGVIYAYDYDATNSVYELVSTSTDPLIADNVYVAGGVLGGLAALIGVAAASNSGGSGGSRNNNSVSANEDNSAATGEDNSAASVIPVTTPSLVDDAGNPVADGATTSDSTPTISGGGMEPGSTVTVSDGDTELGTATVGEDGSWSFTPDAPLADGEHALVIDGIDASGNAVNDTVNVIIDTSATVSGMTDDAGNPVADGATTSDSTPTLSGGGMQPGSTVVITDGDTDLGTATVDADGSWTFTPDAPLDDGEHALVIDGTDANGNAVNDTVNITVDTSATVPGLTDDAGNPVADGATTSDSTPTLSGGGMQPGSTVVITDGSTPIGEATVDADGNWTFTPDTALDDGEHTLITGGIDANGNNVSNSVEVIIDTSATAPGLTDDAGNPVADGATTSDSTPTLSGGGMQPGSTVVITDGSTPIGEATVDADGNWTFTPDTALDDGEHTLITGGIDANGNNVSNSVEVIIDTSATAPGLTDDAGNPVADGATTSDSTPTINGGGMQPGSTVTVSDGDTELGTTTVGEDGSWSFTPDAPLADGEHALVIDGTDANGNAVNDTVNVNIDTSATEPGMTDDAGNPVADGATTSDSTPTLSGGGMQPGSTVVITDGDTDLGTATVDADGSWTFTPETPLDDGEHALVIDGTDASGNAVNDTVNVNVDTSATVPGLTDDAGNPVADGATTSDSTPTLSGGGMQPGSTVTVSDGDAEIGTATVDADGNWTFTPDAPLADGEHALVVDGTDANGNVMNGTVNVTVDTSATVPGLTDDAGNPIADGATTSDSTPNSAPPLSTPTVTGPLHRIPRWPTASIPWLSTVQMPTVIMSMTPLMSWCKPRRLWKSLMITGPLFWMATPSVTVRQRSMVKTLNLEPRLSSQTAIPR